MSCVHFDYKSPNVKEEEVSFHPPTHVKYIIRSNLSFMSVKFS